MEPSEFTKKCQIAEDALREVIEDIDEDNEEVLSCLWDAINKFSNLAIPEGPFIGRSVMKCLLIEQEDNANSMEHGEESLNYILRKIKLLFDAMDELGITRMNKEVFDNVWFIFYDDDEIRNKLAESDEAQINNYKDLIEEIIKVRPDYFERGKPESEIVCDESCRGTEEVISREQWGTVTTRPDKCLYKDWL
jgi:hypothetical protein